MRWLGTILLTCFASAALGTSAVASPEWCAFDPVLVVEGRQAKIVTTFAYSELGSLTGPVSYEISLPANVRASVASPSDPNRPESVTIVTTSEQWSGGPIHVSVRVTVPSTRSLDATITVSGPGVDATLTKQSSSDQPTTIEFDLTR